MPDDYLPILIFAVVAVVLSAIAVLVPALFGPRRPTDVKLAPYESGKLPIGQARGRFAVQYYPWATVFRDLRPRLAGLLEAAVFVSLLLLGLIYVWKKGGLEWD